MPNLFRVDYSDAKNADDLYSKISAALETPEAEGIDNFNALYDCLDYYFDEPVNVELLGLKAFSRRTDSNVFEIVDAFAKADKLDCIKAIKIT
ncbi:MAG: barstar family protein [Pseudomonadota bacterium]